MTFAETAWRLRKLLQKIEQLFSIQLDSSESLSYTTHPSGTREKII